jgi:hypothetical protein
MFIYDNILKPCKVLEKLSKKKPKKILSKSIIKFKIRETKFNFNLLKSIRACSGLNEY